MVIPVWDQHLGTLTRCIDHALPRHSFDDMPRCSYLTWPASRIRQERFRSEFWRITHVLSNDMKPGWAMSGIAKVITSRCPEQESNDDDNQGATTMESDSMKDRTLLSLLGDKGRRDT